MAEDQDKSGASWEEIGQQFQAWGEHLGKAFQAAWDGETTQESLREMQAGLDKLVHGIEQAVKETAASPEGQQAREEAERAAQSLHTAGKKAVEDARPHILDALRRVNDELERLFQGHGPVEPPEGE